jgi:N-acetylneuraminic acid mutarotase
MIKRFLVGSLLLLAACDQNSVEPSAPEILSFDISPTAVEVGESVAYSWGITGATTCRLDVNGDGSPDYTPECSSGGLEHSFSEAGSFTATLNVTENGQSASATAPTVTVSEPVDEPISELTWQPSTPQPFGVAEAQGVAVGEKLYVFGGFDSQKRCCTPTARAHVYSPASATWEAIADLPPMNGTGHGGVTHAGITTDGANIFLAGGYTSNSSGTGQIFGTREVWQYVVATDSYTRLPDLPVARSAGQLEYLGGSLYYFGGTNRSRTADTPELYILDLAGGADSWREGTPLPNARHHMGSTVLSGKIYAVAGQHDHDQRLSTQADVHAYSPESDSWERLADLPLAVSHIANSTFVLDGRIIVVGGEVDHLKPVANVFAYAPETDTWNALSDLPQALQSTVARNIGGRVIVTGGSGGGWRAETYIGVPNR